MLRSGESSEGPGFALEAGLEMLHALESSEGPGSPSKLGPTCSNAFEHGSHSTEGLVRGGCPWVCRPPRTCSSSRSHARRLPWGCLLYTSPSPRD
eukprot:1427572-Alexandrium_andersonii.AAC.1